jgi:ribosomal protein L29
MKVAQLRKQSDTELTKQIVAWREKIAAMIREQGTVERKNVRELRNLRKDIARALTVVSEKKREARP